MFKVANIIKLKLRLSPRLFKLQNIYENKSLYYVNFVHLPIYNNITSQNQIRLKYTQKKTPRIEEHDSDYEIIDHFEKIEKNAKIINANLNSLRMDLVVRAGLDIARNKVENAFYENKIRVNEKKILKKSANLRVGDEIDLIRGFSKSNPNYLIISRIIILDVIEKDDNIRVVMKRFKSLLVENYKDPWKQTSTSND